MCVIMSVVHLYYVCAYMTVFSLVRQGQSYFDSTNSNVCRIRGDKWEPRTLCSHWKDIFVCFNILKKFVGCPVLLF